MTERQRWWAAAALYAGLTFILAYPLSLTANRTLPADDPDGHLFMWTLAWDAHAFLHQPLSIFDANILYPNRDTLAYSENLIGSAIFAAPVLWLTGNPVLAVNVVSLLSCMLCGLGAYVLGRRVGLSAAAATLTGLVFAFSPPRFLRFSQLHLTAVQWIPFALASLHAYLERGEKRDLRLAIAFFTLQVLTSGHGGVFAAVAILLMLAYRLALGEPIDVVRRLRDVGIPGALLLVPVVLFAIPYRVAQVEAGLRRVLDKSGTPLQNFWASPTRVDLFLQSLVTSQDINRGATAWLFPGFLPLLLALAAIVGAAATVVGRVKRPAPAGPHAWGAEYRRSPTAFYLLLTIVSAGLALGGRYGLWRFVYWLPGFNFIRAPSRFMVLGLLGIAVLAGVGFDGLTARLALSRRRLAAVMVGVLLVVEFAAIPYKGVPYRLEIPAVDLWVARQQKPFSIVEVPVTMSERYHSNYMLHSMAHWQKTVNGYSGALSALHEELYAQLRTFPSEDSVRHLAQLQVTYVIVHSSWFPPEERRLVEERLVAFGSSLKLEYIDADSRVYSIQRPSKASKEES